MLWNKEPSNPRLEKVISKCYDELDVHNPSDHDYATIAQNLKTLSTIESEQEKTKLNPNTVLTIAAYAGLTIAVATLEIFGHSMTSRAMSWQAFKPKL